MRVLLQLLGAVAAVAAAGVGAAVLAKKLGKQFPIEVTVDTAERAETDKAAADKTAAAYEAGVAAGKAHAEALEKAAAESKIFKATRFLLAAVFEYAAELYR